MREVPYRKAISLLMYAAMGTHLDIVFTVSFLSQYMQNPGQPHWEAVKHVFHYLKGTHEHVLSIGECGTLSWSNKTCTGLEEYCDTNWALQKH